MLTCSLMGWRFKLLTLGLFGLLTVTSVLTYNWYMEGFSVGQLRFHTDHLHLPPNPPNDTIWTTALAQPYHYLGKGCQFYAFESEDQKYVVKLLKSKHLRCLFALESLPLPLGWKQRVVEHHHRKTARAVALMASCHLALARAPQQTGLLYVHSQPEPRQHDPLLLYDAIGWPHRISLDSHIFLVQYKAQPLTERFLELAALPDSLFIEQVASDLKALLQLLKERNQLGIRDLDRSFVKNVGLIPSGAVWVDIGQWIADPSVVDPDEQDKELQRRCGDLLQWAASHIPQKQVALQKAIDQVLLAKEIRGTKSLEQEPCKFDSGSAGQ